MAPQRDEARRAVLTPGERRLRSSRVASSRSPDLKGCQVRFAIGVTSSTLDPAPTSASLSGPPGPQRLHEIKLDGFRMSARIERGRVQLPTRTGLDWSDKYPSVVEVLAKVGTKPAYLDGELCGIGDGLPSFSQIQAASDGSRGIRLVYFAFAQRSS